ncbi:YrdB family protein [Heyndrickxia sp. NPDC080065]|uniref:YrdB family protein n=1 Tax=Heyndrickxia sp. NPDC080065 TaxID=3390568 RepID=UPI003CFFDC0A
MIIVQYTVMIIMFLIELASLVAFSYWGFHLDKGLFAKIVFGVGTPLLVAIFWGIFIAPKASIPVSVPLRILLQIIIFGLAAVSLHSSGRSVLAILFIIVTIINMFLMYLLKI